MKKEDIVRVLSEYNIVLTEEEINAIPEETVNMSEKVRLGSIRY